MQRDESSLVTTPMTNSDIIGYRNIARRAKAWRHVILCDRALGEPASIEALLRLKPDVRASVEHLSPDDAKKELDPIINADPWSR